MVTKHRSPNYPAIDLRTAVERVKQLYSSVQRGEFKPQDAAEAWGYSGPTSPVRRGMGALRQYGLIESKRGDDARLTPIALTLALREPESREFREALSEAVESPALFKELIESGRAGNARGALLHYLVVERRFTKDGADNFIDVLKTSVAFAGANNDEIITELDEGELDKGEEPMQIATPTNIPLPSAAPLTPPSSMAIPIPLSNGGMGTVTLPLGMSKADWDRLDTILRAYKPSSDEPDPPLSTSHTSESRDGESDAE